MFRCPFDHTWHFNCFCSSIGSFFFVWEFTMFHSRGLDRRHRLLIITSSCLHICTQWNYSGLSYVHTHYKLVDGSIWKKKCTQLDPIIIRNTAGPTPVSKLRQSWFKSIPAALIVPSVHGLSHPTLPINNTIETGTNLRRGNCIHLKTKTIGLYPSSEKGFGKIMYVSTNTHIHTHGYYTYTGEFLNLAWKEFQGSMFLLKNSF